MISRAQREQAQRLYTLAMADEFAPQETPSWSALTWTEQLWWVRIVAHARALRG